MCVLELSTAAKTIQVDSIQIKSLTSELVAVDKEITKKNQSNQRQQRRKKRGKEKVENAH